ncbi:MAG: acetyl-CoA carboxylase biotin carboxyl carrier protein subunit [Rhodothermales bacterium]|nr:acetyl-CoA carboxylase biotin carboxyl carrier protein subunit [Rhodothermales bacterium]
MHLQAVLNDRTVDLRLERDGLTLDGEPADATFTRVAENVYLLLLDGRSLTFTAERQDDGTVRLTHHGRSFDVRLKDERDLLLERLGMEAGGGTEARELKAPMPGLVLQVLVEPGQAVEEGQGLVVLEAMKMENELTAQAAGTVAEVHCAPGSAVGKNDLLISFASG